jgi:hypothetical protein
MDLAERHDQFTFRRFLHQTGLQQDTVIVVYPVHITELASEPISGYNRLSK